MVIDLALDFNQTSGRQFLAVALNAVYLKRVAEFLSQEASLQRVDTALQGLASQGSGSS